MLLFNFDLSCKKNEHNNYLIIVQYVSNSLRTGAVEDIYLSELIVRHQEEHTK